MNAGSGDRGLSCAIWVRGAHLQLMRRMSFVPVSFHIMLVHNAPRSLLSISRSSLYSQVSKRTMSSSASQSSPHRPPRPANWKAAAPEALPGTTTFGAQPTLPRLPVPELQDTLNRLKESLKPIAWSEAEYASVTQKIDDFGKTKGPELQERLLKRASEKEHWLEDWWDDGGYLGYRDSVRLFYHLCFGTC